MSNLDHVDLDRRFDCVSPEDFNEDAVLAHYTSTILCDGGLTWESLLNKALVVVLGEPGSGKTYEFRWQAQNLKGRGVTAFFIRLDELLRFPIEEVLDTDDLAMLRKWQSGKGRAVFFLDSVDEAKFRSVTDFRTVLKKFSAHYLSSATDRATILLSSRISEWWPQTDGVAVASCLYTARQKRRLKRNRYKPWLYGSGTVAQDPSFTSDVEDAQPNIEPLVVKIRSLDKNRIERLVNAWGVSNPADLIEALFREGGSDFFGRPDDVVNLIEYWQRNRQLGSLTELIEFSVTRKLLPSDRDKNDCLSPMEARRGAEALGAATVLCRTFTFKVPDSAFFTENALNAQLGLPVDWTKEQVEALLTRPIFDSASYGRIRFHHRRIAEYLGSQWFAKRMGEGCPTSELKRTLFAATGQDWIARPGLKALSAWLCAGSMPWNIQVSRWVLRHAPNIHLRYGDPSALAVTYRLDLLKAIVGKASEHWDLWTEIDEDALARLANPQLVDYILEVILNPDTPEGLRSKMISLVRYGRMTEGVPKLLALLADVPIGYTHGDVIAAIRDAGDKSAKRKLVEWALERPTISNYLGGLISTATYPCVLSEEEVIRLLEKVEIGSRATGDIRWQLSHHLEEVLTPSGAGALLPPFVSRLRSGPHLVAGPEGDGISQNFAWLLEFVPVTLRTLLRKAVLSGEELSAAVESIMMLGERRYHIHLHDEKTDLHAITISHPEVRRAFVWRMDEWLRKNYNTVPQRYTYPFSFFQGLKPSSSDFEWLIKDLETSPDLDRQLAALRFCWDISSEGPKKRANRRALRAIVKTRPALLNEYQELRSRSRTLWAKTLWRRHWHEKIGKGHWRNLQLHKLSGWLRSKRENWMLIRNLGKLRSGTQVSWLGPLSREADAETGRNWAPENWDNLRATRGALIANAAREGCKRAWRLHLPCLPHEKETPSQTSYSIVVGLSGLSACHIDGQLNFTDLSASDAERAGRYALHELNGFPPWFPSLVQQRPEIVTRLFLSCIEGEWRKLVGDDVVSLVIDKLASNPEFVSDAVAANIFARLKESDPEHHSVQRAAQRIVAGRMLPVDLVTMAVQKVIPSNWESPTFLNWLDLLLSLNASRGLEVLTELVAAQIPGEGIILKLCAALHGPAWRKEPSKWAREYLEPQHLRALIPLIYAHLRTSEDLHHEGSFSPEPRDDAQNFRNGLLRHLASSESPDVPLILKELMALPDLRRERDWIGHLLEVWRDKNADLQPWTIEQIPAFERQHESDPKTDRELFEILLKRMEDLKDLVETSDVSARTDLHPSYHEADLRKWLHRKLVDHSRNRYRCPEEVEIDEKQRPDLRVERQGMPPISVEVKLGEKWTLNEMLDALKGQLVGQYLRDSTVRYGIFVVGLVDPTRQYWEGPDKERLTYTEVLARLRSEAVALTELPGVSGLAVFGIDFRDPKIIRASERAS